MNDPIYTVQRTRTLNTDRNYSGIECIGPVHASDDANITSCGKEIDESWWVLTNVPGQGEVTCRKCLREIERRTHEH